MKYANVLMIIGLLTMTGCMHHVKQQGNVLTLGMVGQVHEGDSRFHVESLLGTPVLKDILHPHRAIYVEDYANPDTGDTYKHKVDITYDAAWRVERIHISGFDKSVKTDK